jgi:hypothetical protein
MGRRRSAPMISVVAMLAALALLGRPAPAGADTPGTFRWQLSPMCNVLTLTASGITPGFSMSGALDTCGGELIFPVFGAAVARGNGTVGIGLTVVFPTTNTTTLHMVVDPSTGAGTWLNAFGQSGDLLPR